MSLKQLISFKDLSTPLMFSITTQTLTGNFLELHKAMVWWASLQLISLEFNWSVHNHAF